MRLNDARLEDILLPEMEIINAFDGADEDIPVEITNSEAEDLFSNEPECAARAMEHASEHYFEAFV